MLLHTRTTHHCTCAMVLMSKQNSSTAVDEMAATGDSTSLSSTASSPNTYSGDNKLR